MGNETYFKVMYYIQNFIDKDTTDTGDYMIKAELKYNRNIFQFNPDRLGTTINL